MFTQSFTASEGPEEGNLIGSLVKQFLTITPQDQLRVFIATNKDNDIVGGVIFSKMRFEQPGVANTWLLSPAAVATGVQGTGVGQKLIAYAHSLLKQEGVQTLVTYGDIKFYSKVGYQPIKESIVPAPLPLSYPEGWIAQSLVGPTITPITGKSYCAQALNNPVYW